jgi:hypothetical protein
LAPKPIREVPPLGVYNPFEEMAKRTGNNSLSGLMGYFDQIMVSQSLIQNDLSSFRYWKPGFTTSLLIQTSGQYKATETAFRN